MKVKDILKILEVVENLPADMYDILHYHEDTKDVGAYFSVSKNKYIPVREMDFVHVLRSFMQLNEYNKENREGYLLIERIKEKANAKQ